jgi:hypothetical protein
MPSNKSEIEAESRKESWNPTAPTGEPVTIEERSLDIGESGQFAPGGYYNQQAVNEPKRVDLDDDDVLTPTRSSHGK